MDWDRLGKVADFVNKVVVSIAILVGGAWGIYTFNGELKRENAQAQLEKMAREVVALKRENLDVEVMSRALRPVDGAWLVEVRVTLRNTGMIDLSIDLPKNSLRVSPIVASKLPEQPTLDIAKQVRSQPMSTDVGGGKAETSSVRAPANSRAELLYLAQVAQSGRYLVEFSAQVRRSDGSTSPDSEWSGSQVLEVDSSPGRQ